MSNGENWAGLAWSKAGELKRGTADPDMYKLAETLESLCLALRDKISSDNQQMFAVATAIGDIRNRMK